MHRRKFFFFSKLDHFSLVQKRKKEGVVDSPLLGLNKGLSKIKILFTLSSLETRDPPIGFASHNKLGLHNEANLLEGDPFEMHL